MSKPVPIVVQFVLVLLQLLFMLLGALLWRLFQARVELVNSVRDGKFLMFDSLGDHELELLCLPNSVEQQDLFLWWYFLLHPKFLHLALVELEDAIIGSLRVVRCHSLVIFWALGWPGQIFPYLYGYQ